MMQAIGFDFSQGLDYPLLFGLNKLMNLVLGGPERRDNFDFAVRYDNSRLLGPLAAPDLVGKCWTGNVDSLFCWRQDIFD